MGGLSVRGRALHPGTATGTPLALTAPLSFWGGTDATGRVVDEHHPQRGASLAGRVVLLPSARGSSSSSSVLAEQLRTGAAPAALLLTEPDAILVLGAWVAAELYGRALPIAIVSTVDFAALAEETGPLRVIAAGDDAVISAAP